MQYALIEFQKKTLLIAANEMQALDTFHDSIAEQGTPDESQHPYHVCYGCYMPPAASTKPKRWKTSKRLTRAIGSDTSNRTSATHHRVFTPNRESRNEVGRAIRIPFAALVQAHTEVIEQIGDKASARRAVTGFLRYAGMSPATNISNRRNRHRPQGDRAPREGWPGEPADWRKHIDRDPRCFFF